MISNLMRSIDTPEHLAGALEHGIAILKPQLAAAAEELRRLCKHRTTIVLTGLRGIDTEAAMKRLIETARAVDGANGRPGSE